MGGPVAADPANGSVEGFSLTVVQGQPTAAWAELVYGNLRQIYVKQWNGSAWAGIGAAVVPPSCDVNGDGVVNSADVDAAIKQALGTLPCTTADLQKNGQCTVVGVQRVIQASLGGACRIGQ